MTSNQSSLVGKIIDEKVRLEAILGQGGMGAVYRGRHLLLDRTVAVKVLRPEILTVEGALERFFREARMAAATEHPNIVTVYDFGKLSDGGAYLILEFVEGKGLRAILQEQPVLPPSLALPILSEVCAAVEFAHRRNVIHRDLKPDNIMLKRRDDGSATVKVLDFGLAKTVEEAENSSSITRTGELVGTPDYMSPEHCSGEDLDARSDLYSLAVIAYEMLCGQPPFRGRVAAILTSQIQRPPLPLREINPNLSLALEEAVLAGLAKKPHDRPASVAEWWNQLETAYVATYGEKPSPAIPLALPQPPPFVAPAVTETVAAAERAILSQDKTLQLSGGQASDAGEQTVGLSARSSAGGQSPPSSASLGASTGSASAAVAAPRAGTGTLAIGALSAHAEDVVTSSTLATVKSQGERPALGRWQRMGLVGGGALALVAAGGLAATSWMRSATSSAPPPIASQPAIVTPPVATGQPQAGASDAPAAPAAQEATAASPPESASGRPSGKARADGDPDDSPGNANQSRSANQSANRDGANVSRAERGAARPEAPATTPTRSPDNAERPRTPSSPPSSPSGSPSVTGAARPPRPSERNQDRRDRRWWEVWKIGREKDKNKPSRPRD